MKDDGIEIQLKQHRKFLKQRSIDRVIQSDLFRDTWDQVNEEKRKYAEELIKDLKIRKLQLWLFDDFGNHTARELRVIASDNHVKNYCKMTKAELIQHFIKKGIKDERNRKPIDQDENNTTCSQDSKTSDSNTIR